MEKQYNHLLCEKKYQEYWSNNNTYSTGNNDGPLYSIDTPPPTVSGSLHMGHVFSYTQTDIIARYKRMNGYSVFYPFGFDDNGLPTERYVEKKRNVRGHLLPRSEFIALCLEESTIAAEQFKTLWQCMGISADWSKTYSTISDQSRRISQASFIELYEKGYVYRKKEVAPYCVSCCTSVSQAELDDHSVKSTFNDIAFKDQYNKNLVISTTRPELLPSCVALLFNPDDQRYIYLKGQEATVPLYHYTVPIIADESVDKEKGTGLVMCCTFGDKKDIEWFKKHNLAYRQSIEINGKWNAHTGSLAGLKVHDARSRVIQELHNHKALIRQKEIVHNVNVHERCKKEIEYMLLAQWFVRILPLRETMREKTDSISWYPSFMESRLTNWIDNLGWDWCISRQRFYGIPFPAWHCAGCDTTVMARTEQLPIDPQETTYQGPCPSCKSTDIRPDTDVMDTWNTSSLTPYICANLYNNKNELPAEITGFLPMSIRPQAHDIIRTWAFDTIVKTTMHNNIVPWHDIVISGHVLSNDKNKLSKSKEHSALTPEHLLTRYPADAIRYWTASGALGYDVPFAENQIKIGMRLITKLWNAFLFIGEHIKPVKHHIMPEELGTLNEWLLHCATKTFVTYQKYHEQYEFGLALNHVEQFFWATFCDNYIELVKHQLFNPDLYPEKEVNATRWTLCDIGLRILQLYAPYVPHVTEAIYNALYKEQLETPSLHQTRFSDYQAMRIYDISTQIAEHIVEIATLVRKLKTGHQLSLKTTLNSLHIYSPDIHLFEQLPKHEQVIRGITHALEILYIVGNTSTPGLEQEQEQWHASINLAIPTESHSSQ